LNEKGLLMAQEGMMRPFAEVISNKEKYEKQLNKWMTKYKKEK